MTQFNEEIKPAIISTLTRARDRRSLLRAGAGAGVALLLGGAGVIAAPVDQAEDAPEDPWDSGACDDAAVSLDDEPEDTDAPDEDEADEVIPPVRLLVPGIEVDAKVEVLEIVAGALQDPSNGDDVAWYKETARPGHEGNAVFAGHLNWYGMPEAVFFAIDQLQEGDKITVRDFGCGEFHYLVEWVELVEVAKADMHEITGPSEEAMLTLITCGGTWDPSISQYKERTVVRARLDGDALPGEVNVLKPDSGDDSGNDAGSNKETGDRASGDDDLGDAANTDSSKDGGESGDEPKIVPRG